MPTASARRREILERVTADGYVGAHELATSLGVNPSTIRRDLDSLAKAGQLQRTHGGARLVADGSQDIPYARKITQRVEEKTEIAKLAASFVRVGDVVILDSGSTTYQIALALRGQRITVITNDLRIAKLVATDSEARLLVTGGELLGSVFTLVGDRALSFFDDLSADWTFLGADAVDRTAGITNTNTLEVPIKRAMIAAAENTLVVVDSSKFGQRALARVASADDVRGIVTDAGIGEADRLHYADKLLIS
ncbi:DeoR/GlpR family DNA-binding transcription regulator [Nocardioides sp. AN3]